MIESNLAVLLAARDLRISKVSADTGISRTTLTSLCNDYTGGIKFETLDTLCKYLKIEPGEFFNYTPYDYALEIVPSDGFNVSDDIIEFEYRINLYVIKDNYRWNNKVLGYATVEKDVSMQKVNCFFEFDESEEASREKGQAANQFFNMELDMSQRQIKILEEKLDEIFKNKVVEDISMMNTKGILKLDISNLEFTFNSLIN